MTRSVEQGSAGLKLGAQQRRKTMDEQNEQYQYTAVPTTIIWMVRRYEKGKSGTDFKDEQTLEFNANDEQAVIAEAVKRGSWA